MFLTYLAFAAFSAQMLSLNALIEGRISLGIAWIWYIATMIIVANLALHLYRVAKWLFMKKRHQETLERFKHWGMDKEAVIYPNVGCIILFLVWCTINLYVTITITIPVASSTEVAGYITNYIVVVMSVLYQAETNYHYLNMPRIKLDALRPIFHKTFSVSEILSMYECLRIAPSIFWEEYANLPDIHITEATNRRFRERVAPYATTSRAFQQRIAGIAIIIALFTVALGILNIFSDGVWLMPWLEEIFSTETDTE